MAITDSTEPQIDRAAIPARATEMPLARLALLHAEAAETARLADLPVRAVPAAASLVVLAALTFLIGGGSGSLGQNFAWGALVFIGVSAILISVIRAMRMPLVLAHLKAFARDLTAALFYTGFAWGAGAFLVLPADAGMAGPLLFALAPALALALMLRERLCVLAFLAPIAIISSFAAGFRPGPGAVIEAGLIFAALGIVGAAPLLARQRAA